MVTHRLFFTEYYGISADACRKGEGIETGAVSCDEGLDLQG